jgi:site-specific recombinase XerD
MFPKEQIDGFEKYWRRRLIALRMFYDYLAYVQEEGIDNPVITQRHYIDRGHHLPRDIRQSEIEKLFSAIDGHLRDRTIFTLMLYTGMRVGEVVHLCLADVFLYENRPSHLRVIGKGKRERIAYLSATAAQLLKEYLADRPDKTEEKVFQNWRGKPITITGIHLQWAKYCHKVDIIKVKFKALCIKLNIPQGSVLSPVMLHFN